MYFPDLSKYNYHYEEAERVNVGWLSDQYDFRKGNIDAMTLLRLKEYPIVNECMGSHACEFCGNANGNGEIEVQGSNGDIFASPAMLIHYIEEHNYLPPDVFINAVNGVPYEPFEKTEFKKELPRDWDKEFANKAAKGIADSVDQDIINELQSGLSIYQSSRN